MRLPYQNMDFFEEDTDQDLINGLIGTMVVSALALLVALKALKKSKKALKA